MKKVYYYFQDLHDNNETIVIEGSINTKNRIVEVGRIKCPDGLVSFMAAFDGKRLLGQVQL